MALELFSRSSITGSRRENHAGYRSRRKGNVERQGIGRMGYPREVIKDHPVLLNGAPTLQPLGIQAFRARAGEERPSRFHRLVCAPSNADLRRATRWAGAHPLSPEAQIMSGSALAEQAITSFRLPTGTGSRSAQDIVLDAIILTRQEGNQRRGALRHVRRGDVRSRRTGW